MSDLTNFEQKVLKALPYYPGHVVVIKMIRKVYGDEEGWVGWARQRGRKAAITKALQRLKNKGKVGFKTDINVLGKYLTLWYKKNPAYPR
ncbi:MAG: hypothetical protein ACW99J_20275 [Candidatus Thorarchaeota archaeon]|jgi:hypothetical protein